MKILQIHIKPMSCKKYTVWTRSEEKIKIKRGGLRYIIYEKTSTSWAVSPNQFLPISSMTHKSFFCFFVFAKKKSSKHYWLEISQYSRTRPLYILFYFFFFFNRNAKQNNSAWKMMYIKPQAHYCNQNASMHLLKTWGFVFWGNTTKMNDTWKKNKNKTNQTLSVNRSSGLQRTAIARSAISTVNVSL